MLGPADVRALIGSQELQVPRSAVRVRMLAAINGRGETRNTLERIGRGMERFSVDQALAKGPGLKRSTVMKVLQRLTAAGIFRRSVVVGKVYWTLVR